MCTHFNGRFRFLQWKTTRFMMILFFLTPFSMPVSAQDYHYPVRINIVVTPPYSPKISEYTNNPNKILATLQNLTVDGQTLRVFLRGEISSSGGLRVYTRSDFKPAHPIILNPNMPYLVNLNTIQDMFSSNQLVYEGITEQEILYGNGLPEDDYTICIRAFDYDTDRPLSMEEPFGCSALFTIASLEPPVIMQPLCHEEIIKSVPQQIVISWTMPAGAPITTQYRFRMVEVSPAGHDVNDAFNSAAQPIFYETVVSGSVLVYGPAQPALVEGKTYAFAVTAFDPAGKMFFRNGGRSEVCSFTWKSSMMFAEVVSDIGFIDESVNTMMVGKVNMMVPPKKQSTTLNGKMNYRYFDPGDNTLYTLANTNLRLVVAQIEVGKGKPLMPANIINITTSPIVDGLCPDQEVGKILATAKTDPDGNFSFLFLNSIEFGKKCALSGEMGYDYYRVALIMIDAPHSSFYFNPDYYLRPKLGEVNNAGLVITKVRSYKLEVTARPLQLFGADLNNAMGKEPLGSVDVYLCRKIDFSYQLYPMWDGRIPGVSPQVAPSIANKFPGFQVVAHGTTGSKDGKITFQRVVWHNHPSYQYYLMADVGAEGDQNYTFGAPMPISPPANVLAPSGVGVVNPATTPFTIMYQYHTEKKSIFMKPNYPRIAGKVSDEDSTEPLAGVKVDMNEFYSQTTTQRRALYPGYKTSQNKSLENCLSNYTCNTFYNGEFMITSSDGTFAFNDLTMLYDPSQERVVGPTRKLLFQLDGYQGFEEDFDILIHGKQDIRNNLSMKKGAYLVGHVRDGDSYKPLAAWVKLPDGKSKQCNPVNGLFKIPVPLLPGKTQKLVVSMNQYHTDTIEFIADKVHNTMNVDLFTLKRRLKVYVRVAGFPFIPVKNCWVHILNVTKNIDGTNYPVGDFTDQDGIMEMAFVNSGNDDDQVYQIRVGMLSNTSQNFETKYYSIKIPYSKHPTVLYANLPRAACIKGYVYAGVGTESSVPLAAVRYNSASDTLRLSAYTDPLGYYYLNNFPVRFFKQRLNALKSQSNFIGDEKHVLITQPSNQCMQVDFNLTVYDDMDITNLMGFPMEVSKLIADSAGIMISGNITDLPANDQFRVGQSNIMPFNKVTIKPSNQVNANGVPLAEPAVLPVPTMLSNINDVMVLKTFTAKLVNTGGLVIDRMGPGSSLGVIKGRVMIEPTEFNNALAKLPALWLASSTNTGTSKMLLSAVAADPTIKTPVSLPSTGFFVCNEKGEALRYSLPGFPDAAEADATKSFLSTEKVALQTTLNTKCNNVSPANLKIKLGNVEISKNDITKDFSNPITMGMNKWTLVSTDWTLTTNGLFLNNSTIKAGMDVPLKNLEITYDAVHSDKTVADFDNLTILGSIPVVMTTTNKGLIYKDIGGGNKQWVVYAAPEDEPQVAYLSGLPGLEGQNLPIALIQMVSDGSAPDFAPLAVNLKLFGLVDFVPNAGSSINIYELATPSWFKVQGLFKPGIPYIEQFKGNIAWQRAAQGFEFLIDNPNPINFTHNNMVFKWQPASITISNDLFTAKGTATEAGKLGPVNVVLRHKFAATDIYIPPNEQIYITQDKSKYFDEVIGGMEVDRPAHQWNNFWFEGVMVGMNGISDNQQKSRLKFICEGDISAKGQSINVSKLDAFPGMSFTYDIANSRLFGSVNIDKNLSGMKAFGTANCIFDPKGWYVNIIGEVSIPGIGGCDLFGLFGDYSAIPPTVGSPFGALKCIPSAFQGKVSGFLLQGGITKQIIPSIEWGVEVPILETYVGVMVKADFSLNARTWMSFDPQVNSYGISLLAEGVVAGGVNSGVLALSTYAKAQMGVSGTYFSNGNYEVMGCGSVSAGVEAAVYSVVDWISVDIPSPSIGLTMKIANTGMSFNMLLGNCGDNLCP